MIARRESDGQKGIYLQDLDSSQPDRRIDIDYFNTGLRCGKLKVFGFCPADDETKSLVDKLHELNEHNDGTCLDGMLIGGCYSCIADYVDKNLYLILKNAC